MQAIKTPPEMREHQQGAKVPNHYYNSISHVVFTSGVLCPNCKRGHLKKHTCDRCGYKQGLTERIQSQDQKEIRIFERAEKAVLMEKVIEKAKLQGLSYQMIAIRSGIPVNSIKNYFYGYELPKQKRLLSLCAMVEVDTSLVN